MQVILGIFLIVSVFEVRFLIKHNEKKEAIIYICIVAAAMAISVYLALNPVFTSFATLMLRLFGAE